MTFNKGDFVLAASDGTGALAQGHGRVSYRAGDELIITSRATSSFVNVRRASGGRVFQIARDKIRPVTRRVGEVPEGAIEADDPRIAWLFEDAGRLADRLGLCRDYDRITDALGVPGRMRTFTIKFEVQEGLVITAKVDARSKKLAERTLVERMQANPPRIGTVKAIGAGA